MQLAPFPGSGFVGFCLVAYAALMVGQVVHLALGAFFVNAMGHYWQGDPAVFGIVVIPADVYLWLNAAVFACGAVLGVLARRPGVVVELVGPALMTPFVLAFFAPAPMTVVLVDIAAFIFSVTRKLLLDYERSFTAVMPSAVASAMKLMPEGVLISSSRGKVIFANDAMRGLLASLGIRADLSNLKDILDAVRGAADVPEERDSMRVRVLHGEAGAPQVWQVTVDDTVLGGRKCTRVLSIDITEESLLEDELGLAKAGLEKTEAQLLETLEEVRDAAADEALIRMRARLHDVIGQRLSLLHRYLEDEDMDDERLEQMKPLLKGIVSDLREDSDIDWMLELDAIVSAFELVGVRIIIDGELPQDADVAVTCAAIVREAVTNAVRHANATEVRVRFDAPSGSFRLAITDNGTPATGYPHGPIEEGQGIAGMRSAVGRLGGTVRVSVEPSFELVVTFPRG